MVCRGFPKKHVLTDAMPYACRIGTPSISISTTDTTWTQADSRPEKPHFIGSQQNCTSEFPPQIQRGSSQRLVGRARQMFTEFLPDA